MVIAILLGSGGNLAGAFLSNYVAYTITRFITAIGEQNSSILNRLKIFAIFRCDGDVFGSLQSKR